MDYFGWIPVELLPLFLFVVSLIVINIGLSIQRYNNQHYPPEPRFLTERGRTFEEWQEMRKIFYERLYPLRSFFEWVQDSSIDGDLVLNFEHITRYETEDGLVVHECTITERTRTIQWKYDFFCYLGLKRLFYRFYGYDKHYGRMKVLKEKDIEISIEQNKSNFKYKICVEDYEPYIDQEEDEFVFETNDSLEFADWFANYYLENLELSWKKSDERKELDSWKESKVYF
jgi:hypothetical protein|tara:strand:- start:522 stop:1208 length:687 start_codon:yes stop_codon:yes gene_type:complete